MLDFAGVHIFLNGRTVYWLNPDEMPNEPAAAIFPHCLLVQKKGAQRPLGGTGRALKDGRLKLRRAENQPQYYGEEYGRE